MQKIQYYLVILLSKFLMVLPKKVRRIIFKFLAYITYLLFSKNKKVIEANLKYIYEDKLSKKEIKKIQKSCYKKLFLTVLSIIENEYLTNNEIESIVEFEGKEYIEKLQEKKQQFIYITAHLGNLDVLGVIIGHFFGKTTHVQQKIKNLYLSNYMQKQREKYGIKVIDKYGAMKKLFLALKRGEIISLVIDQNTNPKYASKVKFLGKDEFQLNTSTTLSKRFNIPILPIFIVGDEDNYKVIIKEPIYPKDKSEDELNQLQADVISEIIFKYPKEWFWCHKRFKNSNPSLYQN